MKAKPRTGWKPMPKPAKTIQVRFSTDPHDPPYWPVGLTALEKIEALAKVAPAEFQAVHLLVDNALREAWRKLSHAEILGLLDLAEAAGRPYHWKCDEPRETKGGA